MKDTPNAPHAYETIGALWDGHGAPTYRSLDLTVHTNGMLVAALPMAPDCSRLKVYICSERSVAYLVGNSRDWRKTPTLQRLEVARMPDGSIAILLPPALRAP